MPAYEISCHITLDKVNHETLLRQFSKCKNLILYEVICCNTIYNYIILHNSIISFILTIKCDYHNRKIILCTSFRWCWWHYCITRRYYKITTIDNKILYCSLNNNKLIRIHLIHYISFSAFFYSLDVFSLFHQLFFNNWELIIFGRHWESNPWLLV